MAIQSFKNWLKTAGLREEEHQLTGLRWCLDRELKAGAGGMYGGIIADEMGLGKTILMLGCILSNFRGPDGVNRTLIVLPKSLLYQWDEVVQRFFGHEALIYHGRQLKKITAEQLAEAPIVLTTYGMISKRAKESPLWNCLGTVLSLMRRITCVMERRRSFWALENCRLISNGW